VLAQETEITYFGDIAWRWYRGLRPTGVSNTEAGERAVL
jgi:hypothetical protein